MRFRLPYLTLVTGYSLLIEQRCSEERRKAGERTMLYMTVLYLTIEQEQAILQLFGTRKWTYLKPDLYSTSCKLGSPGVIHSDLTHPDKTYRWYHQGNVNGLLPEPCPDTTKDQSGDASEEMYGDVWDEDETEHIETINDSIAVPPLKDVDSNTLLSYPGEIKVSDIAEISGCDSRSRYEKTRTTYAVPALDVCVNDSADNTPMTNTDSGAKSTTSVSKTSDSIKQKAQNNDINVIKSGIVPLSSNIKANNNTCHGTSKCIDNDEVFVYFETAQCSKEDDKLVMPVNASSMLKTTETQQAMHGLKIDQTNQTPENCLCCYKCHAQVSSRSVLNRHLRKQHGVTNIVRQKRGPKASTDTVQKRFTCEHCGHSYRRMCDLTDHILMKHSAKYLPHKCDFCEESFIRRTFLTAHINRVHLKEKPFVCSTCKKGFHSIQTRNMHEARGVCQMKDNFRSQYQCSDCNQYFYTRQHYSMHMVAKHSAKDAFKCVCGATLLWKSSVNKHRRNCKVYRISINGNDTSLATNDRIENKDEGCHTIFRAVKVSNVALSNEDSCNSNEDGSGSNTNVLTEGEFLDVLESEGPDQELSGVVLKDTDTFLLQPPHLMPAVITEDEESDEPVY